MAKIAYKWVIGYRRRTKFSEIKSAFPQFANGVENPSDLTSRQESTVTVLQCKTLPLRLAIHPVEFITLSREIGHPQVPVCTINRHSGTAPHYVTTKFCYSLATKSMTQCIQTMEEIYFAGGCLWGVQEFIRHLPGVINTEAGRANGTANDTCGDYDGYSECVRTQFDPSQVSVTQLMSYFFEIIDPYSVNKQGIDVGEKYRTGVYSVNPQHLQQAADFIAARDDADKIVVEVLPLTNFVKSDDEHQDRLTLHPGDYCHIPLDLLHKYRKAD